MHATRKFANIGGARAALALALLATGCSDSRSPVSPGASLPAAVDASGGLPTVRYYTASFTTPTITAGVSGSLTLRITNDSTTSPHQDLGYAEIVVPAGFTGTTNATVLASAGKSWSASVASGIIRVAPNAPEGQNRIVPGEYMDVTFVTTAPSSCDTYTWNTTAYKAPPADTAFVLLSGQPTVQVIGCNRSAPICTYSQGYWKTHPDAWPVSTLALGTVTYTQAQLLSILEQQPAGGNGLVSLAHQLIAAKLNIARGADATSISAAIASADALIGSLVVPPIGSGSLAGSATGALNTALDDYNNGITGPGHCGDE